MRRVALCCMAMFVVTGSAGVSLRMQRATPRVALIVREQVLPDSEKAYAINEAAIASICAREKCPHAYFALTSDTKPTEVWWLTFFRSEDEKGQIDSAWARNKTLMAQLRPLGARKHHLRRVVSTTLTTQRQSPNRGATWRLSDAHFFVIAEVAGRGADGAVFESAAGQRFVVTPAATRAEADGVAAHTSGSVVFVLRREWSFLPPTSRSPAG
jgi:hypothetical protein